MEENLKIEEIGRVIGVSGPLIKIEGLPYVEMEELLEIGEEKALVFRFGQEFDKAALLSRDVVWAFSLGKEGKIKTGEKVERLKKVIRIPVGEELLGKIIDPLGRDAETKTFIETKEKREIEKEPPQIMEREEVKEPLETGIKIIDALFPIGRGQRELIIGDRKTGKTTIALDAVLNQKDVICIWTAIGQKRAATSQILKTLREYGALDYTIVVVASSSDPLVLQYLAPFCAMTIAEYFRDKGKDVLVVFDDLTKHAWAWRSICLLLERPPGREAYPGDIFYLHARLLERAAKMAKDMGRGSISALPICETKGGDISEYIPTNLISITDGQLYLETDLFQKGIKPAINIGLSVSRIGSKAQRKYLAQVVRGLKLILSQHQELKKLLQLETKISKEAEKKFKRGEILLEIFKQKKHQFVDSINQSIIFSAILNGFLDNIEIEKVKEFEELFYKFLDDVHEDFKKEISKKGWTKETKEELKKIIGEFEMMG